MELAVIPPANMVMHMPAQPVHLCLAHIVLKNADYANFYKARREQGDFVILDNSAYELEASLSTEEILLAADVINPSEIVLPDVLHNKDKTLEAISDFLDACGDMRSMFMAVPQGMHYDEWRECFAAIDYLEDNRITTIGIPRLIDDWNERRYPLVSCIPNKYSIHLLGWNNAALPVVLERMYPRRIRSIDTAKPVHYAIADTPIRTMFGKCSTVRRASNYFDLVWLVGDYIESRVVMNSAAMRGWIA